MDTIVLRMALSSTKNAFNQSLSKKLEGNYLGDITNYASMHFVIYVFILVFVYFYRIDSKIFNGFCFICKVSPPTIVFSSSEFQHFLHLSGAYLEGHLEHWSSLLGVF